MSKSGIIIFWEEEGGVKRQSKPIGFEPRARWVAQALMVRPQGPRVLWAELRRGGVTLYRTEASEWC
jgi:hypothetical protein